MKRGMQFSCSGNLATMAPGLPYAIGGAGRLPRPAGRRLRRRRRLHDAHGCEFVTAVKYKLPIKVVVIKNNTLGQIKWEQMVFLGNPEYGVELQPIDFVKFAEACGGVGFRCERAGRGPPGGRGRVRLEAGPRWSRPWSTRSSRRCRRRRPSSRASTSPRRCVRGEPHARQDRSDALPRQDQGAGLTDHRGQGTHRSSSLISDLRFQI